MPNLSVPRPSVRLSSVRVQSHAQVPARTFAANTAGGKSWSLVPKKCVTMGQSLRPLAVGLDAHGTSIEGFAHFDKAVASATSHISGVGAAVRRRAYGALKECWKTPVQASREEDWGMLVRDPIMHVLEKDFGAEMASKIAVAMTDAYLEAGPADLMPGVKEMLVRLEMKEVPVFVVSNAPEKLLLRQTAHLEPYIRLLVGNEPGVAPKPSGAGIELAMSKLRVKPQHVMFVGDAVSDIWAARAAGVVPYAYGATGNVASSLMTVGAHGVLPDWSESSTQKFLKALEEQCPARESYHQGYWR